MKRSLFLALGAASLIAVATMLLVRGDSPRVEAAGVGPTITVGTPSLVSGDVVIPINATGAVADAYAGFNIHLQWDDAIFSFDSASNAGTVIPSPFCPSPVPQGTTGVVYACTSIAGPTSATGLLATITLNVIGTGCSELHLFTFGPPDDGGSNFGTYTVNAADTTPQSNALVDGAANHLGQVCVGGTLPTVTPTPQATATNTPGPTNTPTATNTPCVGAQCPTATATVFLRTVTPTPSTATETPVSTATTAPGGNTPVVPPAGQTATAVAGAPGGVIQPPATGTGDGLGSATSVAALGLLAFLVMGLGGSAVAYGLRRRAQAK